MANALVSLNSKELELLKRVIAASLEFSPITLRQDLELLHNKIVHEKAEFDRMFPDQKWEY